MPAKLLRLPEVRTRVPFSKQMIYLLMSRGEFPRPVPMGARAVAWREVDIDAWIASRSETAKPETVAAGR